MDPHTAEKTTVYRLKLSVTPITFSRVVTVRIRLISSFSHEFPLVLFEFAFDYLVIEILQSFRVPNLGEGSVHLSHVKITHFTRNDTEKKGFKKCAVNFLSFAYPSPSSLTIFSLKSTEFIFKGFHFNTSSQRPAV